jgi:glycosyltransferase involved in cell wall biosynthesis
MPETGEVVLGRDSSRERKLLVLETDYTLQGIRQRGIEHSILCRDLDGYFSKVWSVHPFASLVTSPGYTPRFGRPVEHHLSHCHTFIEGKVGRYATLKHLFALNFLLSQADLFLRLKALIRRERISVIRVANPLYLGLFGLALARSTRIPLVVRVGANNDKIRAMTGKPMAPRLLRSQRLEKAIERFVFKRADLVAGANQDNLDFALANGATTERSTLFRYGNLVDRRHFTDPAARGDCANLLRDLSVQRGNFLLYVGRLEPIKQPDHVVAVLAKLRGQGLDLKAVLAGEGSMREDLRTCARELGVDDALVLAGNLTQADLAILYPAAAVVISPHTGRALAEAAMGAAPVVAYDVDWQGELVENLKTGLLVPYQDVGGMVEAAKQLIDDRGAARELGKNLREKALSILNPANLDEHERQEYRKLLARVTVAMAGQ